MQAEVAVTVGSSTQCSLLQDGDHALGHQRHSLLCIYSQKETRAVFCPEGRDVPSKIPSLLQRGRK